MNAETDTRISYRVPAEVLVSSRELLAEIGAEGFEAVVVWVGRWIEPLLGQAEAVWRPEQVCYRSEHGVGVEVPSHAISALISALAPDMLVLARLHTHPGCAYHSDVDDGNMLVAHQGAISIVVPDFARDPIDLAMCSVNELRHGEGWIELAADEVAARFAVG